MQPEFADPQNFLPRSVLTWLTDIQLPALIKHGPGGPLKFIVREPDGNGGYLTVGAESDFSDDESQSAYAPAHNMVIASMVKERETTFSAVDIVAKRLSKALKRYISPDQITYSGLKDRWARTVQFITIEGVTVDEVKQVPWEILEDRAFVFLKDIRPCTRPLNKGDHGFNRFEIVVDVPSYSAADISDHVGRVVRGLFNHNSRALNGVGRQRLGRRQNLHKVGRVALTGDLTIPPSQGVPPFNSALEAANYMFLFDIGPEKPLAVETRTRLEPCWLFNFREMRTQLGRVYRGANMSFEMKIVERLADVDKYGGSFEEVMKSMRNEYSLWVGAWQSYWWNQGLSHQVEQSRLNIHDEIPLPMCTQLSMRYYLAISQRLPSIYTMFDELWKTKRFTRERPTTIDQVNRIIEDSIRAMRESDCLTRLLFLVPRTLIDTHSSDTLHSQLRKAALATHNKYGKKVKGPKRPAMAEVRNLEYTCHDNELRVQVELGSGAYATTFLGQIFDLIDPDDPTVAGEAQEEETAADATSVTAIGAHAAASSDKGQSLWHQAV